MSVRVLVADDQEIVRTGLVMILDAQPDIEVIGEAADGRRAVELARRLRSNVVMTTTASGSATPGPASRRVASMPSVPGIRMSNRHTSGRRRRASSTARRPSAASPTTSMPGWALRIILRPVRTISWSSATSTRTVTRVPPPVAAPR